MITKTCADVRMDTTPSPPVRMRLHFDGTLSLLSTNVIIECPPTHPPTTISYGFLISRTEL